MSGKRQLGLHLLEDWAILEANGPDTIEFLHGQFTNDIKSLPEDEVQLSAYCEPKGKMIANFLIWKTSKESCQMLVPEGPHKLMLQRLQMFKMRSNVEINDTGEHFIRLGIMGDGCRLPFNLPKKPRGLTQSGPYTIFDWPGDLPRWFVTCEHENAGDLFDENHEPESGSDLWRLWDIEDGFPLVRGGNEQKFVPQHLNMDLLGGISFEKGCYPGQEVVARMKYRGEIKFRTYRLVPTEPTTLPSRDKDIYVQGQDRPCGRVVDAVENDDSFQILASLRVANADGTLLLTPDGPTLEMLPLPYELTEKD